MRSIGLSRIAFGCMVTYEGIGDATKGSLREVSEGDKKKPSGVQHYEYRMTAPYNEPSFCLNLFGQGSLPLRGCSTYFFLKCGPGFTFTQRLARWVRGSA